MTHFYLAITYWNTHVGDCMGDQGSVNELRRSLDKSVHEVNIR